MSWRDVLSAAPHSPQYSRNPHNNQPAEGCEDIGNTGKRVAVRVASASTRAAELRREAAAAPDWDGLDAVQKAAQVAYDASEATRQEVECLAGYVGDRSRQEPEDAGAGALGQLLRSQPVVRVRSRLLGEVVVWVADAAEAPVSDEVVYREAELRRLVGRPPVEVCAIHRTKRVLDGEVVA